MCLSVSDVPLHSLTEKNSLLEGILLWLHLAFGSHLAFLDRYVGYLSHLGCELMFALKLANVCGGGFA